ncbi:MAG: mechanosensitive ion channel [Treponema sp.]|nr:mechanosensitive ion channel [Treponema sp.]
MSQFISNLWATHSDDVFLLAKNILVAIIIIIIGIVTSKVLLKLIKKVRAKFLSIDGTVYLILKGFVRYGIFVVCAVMILSVFGVNTTSLLAVMGAAGLAVGLALKDTMGNIAAGIIIIVLGCYRRDEFVEFSSFMGTVKEINLFTTILETPDGIYISAPNASIWGSPLRNYSRNGKRRMELSIGIAYSDSVDTAFQVMQDIIAAEPRFLKDPMPMVILQAIESHSVRITIRAWAAVQDYWDIFWDLNKIIKGKIEAAGLCVPLPQRDVRVVNPATYPLLDAGNFPVPPAPGTK